MPSTTITVQNTLNWLTAFIQQRPTTGIGGNANEPALTSANYIMATILQPPFRWSWNRTSAAAAITTVAGTADYPVVLSSFGYLEKAVLVNPTPVGNQPPNFELQIWEVLGTDGKQNRPLNIAKLLDDNQGNITFRLFPIPDQAYTVNLVYQNAPPVLTSLNSLWSPIPDKYNFLYERGLLAMIQMTYNQQLALSNLEIFFRQLVAVSEGLDDEEKAIFFEDSLRTIRMRQTELQAAQQGKQARL
jgi:hypothetical protein